MRLFMTVQGRSQDTSRAIARSPVGFGVESSKPWLEHMTPEFVDFPFTDPTAAFEDHLSVVRETRPEIAVAPDIEQGRDPGSVILAADRLAQYAETVVVVPKSIHPSRVPDRFRVGVPLADFGSDAPWPLWAYQDCAEVHLLGGGPARQLTARQHLGNVVKSLDTSSLCKLCQFGLWDGGTVDAPELAYQERLERSLKNYHAAWT